MSILYSFRRCPYAIRARMIIAYSEVEVEIREVSLKDKPAEMLLASPKGTVPVLLHDDGVLEESLDIMSWAISQNDSQKINLSGNYREHELINENDQIFKTHLDHYKYADRFPEHEQAVYRARGETFLAKLNTCLSVHRYLTSDQLSIVDIAIFPFIRQFAFVDKHWFDQTEYHSVKKWLENFLALDLFIRVMPKLTAWQAGDDIISFPFKTRT